MDIILKDKFKNSNDGDIIIYSNDNITIKAHSIVLYNTTEYFKNKTEIKLDYPAEIIIMLINYLYNSNNFNFNFENIYKFIKLYELSKLLKLHPKVYEDFIDYMENIFSGLDFNFDKPEYLDIWKSIYKVHPELNKSFVHHLVYYLNDGNSYENLLSNDPVFNQLILNATILYYRKKSNLLNDSLSDCKVLKNKLTNKNKITILIDCTFNKQLDNTDYFIDNLMSKINNKSIPITSMQQLNNEIDKSQLFDIQSMESKQ